MGPPHPSSVCQSNNHLEAHSGTTFLDETSPVRNGFGVWPLVVELSHPWAVEISWCSPWVAFWLLVPCYGWIPYDHAHGLQFHDDSTFGIDGCSPQPHPPNSRPGFCWGESWPVLPCEGHGAKGRFLSPLVPGCSRLRPSSCNREGFTLEKSTNTKAMLKVWQFLASRNTIQIRNLGKNGGTPWETRLSAWPFFSTPLTPVCAFGRSNQRIKNAGC